MRQSLLGMGLLVLLLAGCGGYAPLHRAQDVVFDVPYIAHEKKEGDLTVGVKQLSIPEVKELFCRSDKLLESYQVLYMRAHNVGQHTYFLHVLNSQLPQRKDIETFFDPHSAISTIGHVICMVPVGVGLGIVTHDALTFFLSFLGISMGVHMLENYALGVAGYDKLSKYAVVTDPDRGTPGLAVLPFKHEHYFLFMPRKSLHASQVTVSVACKDMVTKELQFDMGVPHMRQGL